MDKYSYENTKYEKEASAIKIYFFSAKNGS